MLTSLEPKPMAGTASMGDVMPRRLAYETIVSGLIFWTRKAVIEFIDRAKA
jgi:hypothetical protein